MLYEIQRKPGSTGNLGRIYLRYLDVGIGRVEEVNYPLTPGVLASSLEESSDRFRFIACVAEMAELLRNSYWSRNGSYGKVIEILNTIGPAFQGRPEFNEVRELLIRTLRQKHPRTSWQRGS